jgi:hypothetical protein
MVRALSHVLFFFNPGPVWRVPIPNRYTAKAKLCFCKNNKRTIIIIIKRKKEVLELSRELGELDARWTDEAWGCAGRP